MKWLKKRWFRQLLKAVGMLLVVCLLVRWVRYDISSIAYFAPMEKAADFTVEDFYQLVAEGRSVKQLCQEVVVVDIDTCKRTQIAEIIEAVDYCEPAAVGLDIFFDYPSVNDEPLLQAIRSCQHIVLPVQVEYEAATDSYTHISGSFFYNQLNRPLIGAVNLAGSSQLSIVRQIRPYFTQGHDTLPHLVSAMLAEAHPKVWQRIRQRGGNQLIPINYAAYEFHILKPHEVLASAELLKGKMVLIGSVDDPIDRHLTPTRSEMPGLLIHAHSLSTLLHDVAIRQAPAWINWLLGLALCLLMLQIKLATTNLSIEGVLMRIIQLILLYLIVMGGYQLFVRYNYSLDLSFALLMVGLGFVAADLWESGSWIYEKVVQGVKCLRARQKKEIQTQSYQEHETTDSTHLSNNQP